MKYLFCYTYGDSAVSDYFTSIIEGLQEKGHECLVVTSPVLHNLPETKYFCWPSKRPTKWSDFLFFFRICRVEKPDCVVANFGAINICILVSFLLRVRKRIVWYHTTSTQVSEDSSHKIKLWFQRKRKFFIYESTLKSHGRLFVN